MTEQQPDLTEPAAEPAPVVSAPVEPEAVKPVFGDEFLYHMHAHAERVDEINYALDDGNLDEAKAAAYWLAKHKTVEGTPDEADLRALRDGVALKDGPTRPARARLMADPPLWPRDPPVRCRARIPTSWIVSASSYVSRENWSRWTGLCVTCTWTTAQYFDRPSRIHRDYGPSATLQKKKPEAQAKGSVTTRHSRPDPFACASGFFVFLMIVQPQKADAEE